MYSFGLFTTTIFANAGQVVTGNPTPHFLSVCRPNYTALGCPPPSPDRPGPDLFVTDQGACAGSPSLVAAARRAFPCKDAALCAYAVTYTAVSSLERLPSSLKPPQCCDPVLGRGLCMVPGHAPSLTTPSRLSVVWASDLTRWRLATPLAPVTPRPRG